MKRILVCLSVLALPVFAAPAGPPFPRVKNEAQFTGKYYSVSELTEAPVVTKPVNPSYPAKMYLNKVPGEAKLAYIISEKGKPEEVQIVSATNQPFGDAAKAALVQWRFKPGRIDGKPVRTMVTQVITFNPEDIRPPTGR